MTSQRCQIIYMIWNLGFVDFRYTTRPLPQSTDISRRGGSRGKYFGEGEGQDKKVNFLSSPSKHRPKLPDQPFQPSTNAPCITVGFTTAYCCCNQRLGGQGSRLAGGNFPTPSLRKTAPVNRTAKFCILCDHSPHGVEPSANSLL